MFPLPIGDLRPHKPIREGSAGQVNNCFYRLSCVPLQEQCTAVSLNNNTPVNTEVLWGGGLWWGLWAGAPAFDYGEDVLDVDITIVIEIA